MPKVHLSLDLVNDELSGTGGEVGSEAGDVNFGDGAVLEREGIVV